LHERVGSQQATQIYGELLEAHWVVCEMITLWREDLSVGTPRSSCGHKGSLRPHVVWFGEMPFFMDNIHDARLEADLFVALGTSGSVYPAAGFVSEARGHGIRTCEINLEPSDGERQFDEGRYGPAPEAVPKWVEDALSEGLWGMTPKRGQGQTWNL
jgi:NAD-dependent deacetylase